MTMATNPPDYEGENIAIWAGDDGVLIEDAVTLSNIHVETVEDAQQIISYLEGFIINIITKELECPNSVPS